MIRKRIFMSGFAIATVILLPAYLSFFETAGAENQTRTTRKSSAASAGSKIPVVLVTTVKSQQLIRQVRLPAELQAYQDVALYAKVPGFVESIAVDRGSFVKRGQLLARLTVPELASQRREVEAKVRATQSQQIEATTRIQAVKAQRAEAEAKLASDNATYQRLKRASETPGVVAGNDLEIALRTVEADQARIQQYRELEKAAEEQLKSLLENEKAARAAAQSVENIESYLRIRAPFGGIVTERNAHPGSYVGPPGGSGSLPMLRIQDVSRLRLVVPVPEAEIGGVVKGTLVQFSVRAFPGQLFIGSVQRIGHSVDFRTRTMPVEVDVINRTGLLAPGMFPEVLWPSRRPGASLFVPPASVVSTTERTFVIRVRGGEVEWVDVRRGQAMDELVEVFGKLAPGETVVLRGTDELRPGTRVVPKSAK
ncbi:MAG TPA: efflux RND transporter periplasmic adaptor subunit [Acidobacteriota bacterium]|jgi:RND family efflux transporter MFP subunit